MKSFPQSYETRDGRTLLVDFARLEELHEIYDFIVEHFIPSPPIRQLSQYDDGPEEFKRPSWLLEYVRKCLHQPHSLRVRDPNSLQLAAVMLNIVEEPSAPGNDVHPKNLEPENLTMAYLAELYRDVDLFKLLDVDRIFHLSIVAVSSDYAQQGLASKLYQLSLDIASELGIGAAKTEAGSSYVAKLATKYGFVSYKALDFAAIDFNGTKPLAEALGMGEHKTARLMARPLP